MENIFEPFVTTLSAAPVWAGGGTPHRPPARRALSACQRPQAGAIVPCRSAIDPMRLYAICVVKNEEDIIAFISEALTSEGHAVTEAGDGQEALRLLAAHTFHLMITDLRMPRLDGMALLRRGAPGRPGRMAPTAPPRTASSMERRRYYLACRSADPPSFAFWWRGRSRGSRSSRPATAPPATRPSTVAHLRRGGYCTGGRRHPQGRANLFDGASSRRERHGQGGRGARHPRLE